jgi:hypothetical protein
MVERGHLVHLGLRQAHLLRQGRHVRGADAVEAVLDLVQVLDEQVALARRVAKQVLHFLQCLRIDAAATRRFALALARCALRGDGDDGVVHGREL